MSSDEISLIVDCQAKQLKDTSNHASASQSNEQTFIPAPDVISRDTKVLDGNVFEGNKEGEIITSSQLPTLSKSEIRRKKFCSVTKKCWTGIKKGVSVLVDGLYRLFDGKMMVILKGLCNIVWIALGIVLTIAVGVFAIATCAAACVR